MILDSIVLDNFGAYSGRQEAKLTPEDGKPIILFGGMNGGGKTTLLDSIQLVLYGSKARISNRGKLSYKDYLRESIHRGCESDAGAGITVRFRRMMDGEYCNFELQRTWREGRKDIEETVSVLRDGQPDNIFTEHWDEMIEAYLPSSIAHLFFFDAEQIKELAEGEHTAEILKAAVYSLLGLDMIDRLQTDLKVFEGHKNAEKLDSKAAQELKLAREELVHIDEEQAKVAQAEGALNSEFKQLEKKVRKAEEQFRSEGGELYLRRNELQDELKIVEIQKTEVEGKLRELLAGPLPLLMVETLLGDVESAARHETEIRRARILFDVLKKRDEKVLEALQKEQLPGEALVKIGKLYEEDRQERAGLANEQLILDVADSLAPKISHMRSSILPIARQEASGFVEELDVLEEKIERLKDEKNRVPDEDRIAGFQNDMEDAREALSSKRHELESLQVRVQALERQRLSTESRLDRLGENDIDKRLKDEDKHRMLKHSKKVRETLTRFRTKVVQRHISNMETLMLESFCKLLHKKELIKDLAINPESFEVTLTGKDGNILPFDRLSAGERQLLATSMLWGLARSSGRPIPTVIDTPLGRLDSSHRKHLIKRYFPEASHQVLLLSTDEEIIGSYYKELEPFITRTYLLEHNEAAGQTNIKQGYFNT